LNKIIEDARPRIILTSASRSGAFQDIELLVLDGISSEEPKPEPLPRRAAQSLAYVLYTSGSTGRPKGVMMEDGPLDALIEWQVKRSALPVGARTLQFASLGFDVSFQEMFATWAGGGTLVLLPGDLRRDLLAVADALETSAIERFLRHRLFCKTS
jgi:non-ribosomal peptide synthetase component F